MRPTPPPAPIGRSWNITRDIVSAVLLVVAAVLPWNVHFGVGVPDGKTWLFAVLVTVTVLALVSLPVAKLRLIGTLPYLLLVAGVVGFTLFELLRYGGTGEVPGGVGPGAVTGLAGALLAAQPALTGTPADDERFRSWFSLTRTLGLVAMVVATFSSVFILYWRARYVVPGFEDPELGKQNIVVAATTAAYGMVPLIVVLVGLRWLMSRQASAMLATVALGASTVLGSVVVWILPIGREIDAFHGIAQATTTAGVGFEAYLAWAASAAIVGPLILRLVTRAPRNYANWQDAARRALALIALWCLGSALLRIVDLVSVSVLGLPSSPYDSLALMAFDVVAAVVAVWLRFNVRNPALHPVVISAISGVLVILVACRVVVGVGLAQKILYVSPPEGFDSGVYGNSLAQQITSTFDVVLCFLALTVAGAALLVLQRDALRESAPSPAAPPVKAPPAAMTPPPVKAQGPSPRPDAVTSVVSGPPGGAATDMVPSAGGSAATQQLPKKAPKIARSGELQSTQRIKIATPHTDSTQRFSGGSQSGQEVPESTQRFPSGPVPPAPKDPPA